MGWVGRLIRGWSDRRFREGAEAVGAGDLVVARRRWKQALAGYRATGDREGAARCLNSLGNVFQLLGLLSEAGSCYERALSLHRAVGDRRGQAADLGNLGVVRLLRGDLRGSRACHEGALALYMEHGRAGAAGVARQLGNLGNVALMLGDLTGALDRYEQARRQHEDAGDPAGLAADLVNAAEARRLLGDMVGAHADLERAQALYRDVQDLAGEAAVVGSLGLLAQEAGELDAARASFETASQLRSRSHERLDEVSDLINLANVLRQLGKLDEAADRYADALAGARQAGFRRGEALALAGYGLIHQSRGELQGAIQRQDEAFRLAEGLEWPELTWRILAARGDTHRLGGDSSAAWSDYAAAIDVIESMRGRLSLDEHRLGFITRTREHAYASLVTLLVGPAGLGLPREALSVAERSRSRALLEQLSLTPLPAPAAAGELVERERHLIEQLRAALAGSARSVAGVRGLEGELDALWTDLALAAPDYVALRRASPMGMTEIVALLREI